MAHCLSPIPSHFFCSTRSSSVSGTLQQLEANGNKRDVRHTGKKKKKKNATIPSNISHLLWGWAKEQEVTRERKKGSGADYWKERVSFSGQLMGHQTPGWMAALWSSKPPSLSPPLTPLLPCFLTGETVYIGWLQAWNGCSFKVLILSSQHYKLATSSSGSFCRQSPLYSYSSVVAGATLRKNVFPVQGFNM